MSGNRPPSGRGTAGSVRRVAVWAEHTVVGDLLSEVRRTRLLDLAYTLAAQTFVALIPLMLVVTAAFLGQGDQAVVSRQLIERFGLVGAARQAVQVLFETPAAGSGIYWLGVFFTLYSSFSLSRRVARAYTTIWDVRPLPVSRQWVGLVWVAVQVLGTVAASSLRSLGRYHGATVGVVVLVLIFVGWTAAEYLVLQLLTDRQLGRSRVVVGAVLVSVGRLGVGVWSAIYLPASFAREAEQYGPIGVVFSFFTLIFASVAATVGALLVAKVFTERRPRDWFAAVPPRGDAPDVHVPPQLA